MVAGNFLCSADVAGIFWFTDLWARHGHARIANHRGRCPLDCILRPDMGRECIGPVSMVRLRRPVKITFTHLFVRGVHVKTAFVHLDRPLDALIEGTNLHSPTGLATYKQDQGQAV
jgi:hypothetical protein